VAEKKNLSRGVTASVERLRREASFVFGGTVQRAADSSLSAIPAGPATAVVRVERVYFAPPDLANQAGQEVTVIYAEPAGTEQESGARVFFADPVAYGETLAVREIGSIAEPDDHDAIEKLVDRVTGEMEEERLKDHLASADAVVHGTVSELRAAPEGSRRFSEHDPDWWIATIRVKRSFKGDIDKTVRVRYPNSRDVRWYETPKPVEGQEAIFVLHRDGLDIGNVQLAILHPTDVVPAGPDELDRHGRLIGRRG
jgi:hypothetical protein